MNEIKYFRNVSISENGGVILPIPLVQDDNEMPVAAITLTDKGSPYEIPGEARVFVKMRKPDGHFIYNEAVKSGNTVLIIFTKQMTAAAGNAFMNIEIQTAAETKNSQRIPLRINENAVPDRRIQSGDEILNLNELLEKYTLWLANLPRIGADGSWEIFNPNTESYEDTNVKATGLIPKGEYNPATSYEKMDMVSYQGNSFLALKAVQGVVPDNDNVNWTLLVKKGQDGKSAYQYAKEGGFEGTEEEFKQYQTSLLQAKNEAESIKGQVAEQANQLKNELIPNFKAYVTEQKSEIERNVTTAQESAQTAAGAAGTAENAKTSAEQSAATATAKASESSQSAETARVEANRAKSEADRAAQISGNLGWFPTLEKLKEKHPTGQDGWIAVIGQTDTIWTWDSDTGAWVDTKGNGTTDYNSLINRPQINGITLNGNQSLADLGIQAKGEYITPTALDLKLTEKADKNLENIENSVLLNKSKSAGLLDKATADGSFSTKTETTEAINQSAESVKSEIKEQVGQTYLPKSEKANKVFVVSLASTAWQDVSSGVFSQRVQKSEITADDKLNIAPANDELLKKMVDGGVLGLIAKNEAGTVTMLLYGEKPNFQIDLQIEIVKTTQIN